MGFIKFKFEEDEPEDPLFGTQPTEDDIDNISLDKNFLKKTKQKEEDEFVINWEKKLGFIRDPFVDEILTPIKKFIVGYKEEREMLNLFIIESKIFGTISAEKGYGKSTVIFWLAKQLQDFRGRINVIMISGKTLDEGRGFLISLVSPLLGFIEKNVSKKYLNLTVDEITVLIKRKIGNRKLVLIIDDFTSISKQNLGILNDLMESIKIRVILSGTPDKISNFKKTIETSYPEMKTKFKDRLNIHLKGLSFDDIKKLIMKRVEHFEGIGIEPFNEPYLKKIYKLSDQNPQRMLNSCHDEAMKLSVDPNMVKKLKEEAEEFKAMIYSSEGFEHKGIKSEGYDKIEIVKHESKKPITISEDKSKFQYSNMVEEDNVIEEEDTKED